MCSFSVVSPKWLGKMYKQNLTAIHRWTHTQTHNSLWIDNGTAAQLCSENLHRSLKQCRKSNLLKCSSSWICSSERGISLQPAELKLGFGEFWTAEGEWGALAFGQNLHSSSSPSTLHIHIETVSTHSEDHSVTFWERFKVMLNCMHGPPAIIKLLIMVTQTQLFQPYSSYVKNIINLYFIYIIYF